MRATIRAALVATTLVAAAATPALAQQGGPPAGVKIAYVNTQSIFQSAPGRAEAEAQFERETNSFREQVKRMDDSLNVMVSDYQKNVARLDSATRTRRETTIRSKQEEYRQRASTLEEQLGQRRDALLQPIMERIRTALDQIRAEDGYALILNNDPQGSLIVSADKNLDITERVVARLKTLAANSPPARPASGAPVPAPAGVTRRP
ncbi:MAG: OmpH family outer membrane protein [Gemmatimonadaceae bacterium]